MPIDLSDSKRLQTRPGRSGSFGVVFTVSRVVQVLETLVELVLNLEGVQLLLQLLDPLKEFLSARSGFLAGPSRGAVLNR